MTDVLPPQLWWSPSQTTTNVLEKLRLTDGDVDEARIGRLVPAAATLIGHFIDPCDTIPDDALLQECLELVTVELYRRKDSPPTSSDQWAAMAGTLRFGAVDPLAEVLSMLVPYKQSFGVA